ncbi:MAG: hypothetical protein AAF513_02495 [Pseudomonadota bacterium]
MDRLISATGWRLAILSLAWVFLFSCAGQGPETGVGLDEQSGEIIAAAGFPACDPPRIGDTQCFPDDASYAQFKNCVVDSGDNAACAEQVLGHCVDNPPGGDLRACFEFPGALLRYQKCVSRTPALPHRNKKCFERRNTCRAGFAISDDACKRLCPENSVRTADGQECEPVPPPCPQGEGWVRDENTWHCSEIPNPIPPQPAYPSDEHFQFDYIIRELTDEQAMRIRHGVLDMTTLVDRSVCRFVATNARTTEVLNMRDRGGFFSIELDARGGADCTGEEVIRYLAELQFMVPGHNGLTSLSDDPIGAARTNNRDFRFWYSWWPGTGPTPVIYQRWHWPAGSPAGTPFTATFEFLGRVEDESRNGTYILAFYGSTVLD